MLIERAMLERKNLPDVLKSEGEERILEGLKKYLQKFYGLKGKSLAKLLESPIKLERLEEAKKLSDLGLAELYVVQKAIL